MRTSRNYFRQHGNVLPTTHTQWGLWVAAAVLLMLLLGISMRMESTAAVQALAPFEEARIRAEAEEATREKLAPTILAAYRVGLDDGAERCGWKARP